MTLPNDDQKRDRALERLLRDVTGSGVVLDAEAFDKWWRWNFQAVSMELKCQFYPNSREFKCACRASVRMREACERELFVGL